MKPEAAARRALVAEMKAAGLDPEPIENTVGVGTPDINWSKGWIELKVLPAWPSRSTTPVCIPHFTAQQRAWILSRSKAGGLVHIVLKVGRKWLLLDGEWAANNLGKATQADLTRRNKCNAKGVADVAWILKGLYT
jgi:hypothetical protein